MTGTRELKALVEIGLLIEQLGNAPLSFLEEIDEGLARQIAEVRGWLASALAKWKELPAEVKIEQLASRAGWRKSKFDEGEFVYADEVPELKELLSKCETGRMEAGGFAYYLRGNVIKRYRRKRQGSEAERAENAR